MDIAPDPPATAASLFRERLGLVVQYAELLATSGVERGLIGPREVPRLWERHIVNCAVIQEQVPQHARLADVGSGAGLPGLVLAIARPDLTVTLIEPLLRRTTWLLEVVHGLGLVNAEVLRGRAEQVAASTTPFDVVTARAVAPFPALLDVCLPLLAPRGVLLAMKGTGAAEELTRSAGRLEQAHATGHIEKCGVGVVDPPTTVVRIAIGL